MPKEAKKKECPYACKVFREASDQRAIEKIYNSFNPDDAAALPAFVMAMDRLVSDFRAQFRPDKIEDGDVDNLEEEYEDPNEKQEDDDEEVEEDDDDGDDVDVKVKVDVDDDDDEDSEEEDDKVDEEEEEDEDNKENASLAIMAASQRVSDEPDAGLDNINLEVLGNLSAEKEQAIKDTLSNFHVTATKIAVDDKNNYIVVGTTLQEMALAKVNAIQEKLQEMFPTMEGLRVRVQSSRVAFRLVI